MSKIIDKVISENIEPWDLSNSSVLMQAGQKLSRYIKAEHKANELEEKIRYIEQFGPILVEGLARITNAKEDQKKRAREGLLKILGRDATATEKELTDANKKLEIQKAKDAEESE